MNGSNAIDPNLDGQHWQLPKALLAISASAPAGAP
jgi:hypothetical protein